VEKTWLSPYFLLGLPLIIVVVYLILRYLKPFKHSLFFLSWFFIGLAPFYHWVAPLHATLLEHWVYFPMIGFLVIAVSLLFKFWGKLNYSGNKIFRIIAMVLFIGLLIYYAATTIIRNQAWRDPLTLYLNDLEYEPQSFLLYNNLGVEYFRRGQMIEAKKAFLSAIEVSPGSGYSIAHNNVGVIYENEGQIDQAVLHYQKSIILNDYLLAYRNLVRMYLNQGQVKQAEAVLQQGLNLYPQDQELNEYFQALGNLPVDR
ncbi:tetratricopeptide repeat protein, partial [Patescibacteria group bacterium]|nr:tetratricopeptide repeat protein [Patescibacteria group bacterium]